MLEKNEEVKEKKGLTEKLYVTTCQLEEKVVANTLQQTEENVGEGEPESSSTDDENVFDDVDLEGLGVLASWKVKSQLHKVGILPNAAGKNDNASADASGDGMIEQSLSLVNSKISESDMDK